MTTIPRLLVAIFASFIISSPAWSSEFSGRVTRVIDGDTIEVFHDSTTERIRLAQIDCPEKRQPFGQQAKGFTSEHVFGKTVTVETQGKDRYGRTIGEVILPNGTDLNYALVAAGYAWQYRRYSNDPKLAFLEAQSRSSHLGLWIDEHPIAPWDFRHHNNNHN